MSNDLKRDAALAALDEVRDGMVIGLGTGSTANHFIENLGRRVSGGLHVKAIATSEASYRLALEVGVSMTSLEEHPEIELTVDGADEISPRLDLIKGLGGALFREKVVAKASRRLVIVGDESKLVTMLGERTAVPVEVVPFSATVVSRILHDIGGDVRVRTHGGQAVVTDNGNWIVDWRCGPIADASELERTLKAITGVVESGIFAGLADMAIVASSQGVRRIGRP